MNVSEGGGEEREWQHFKCTWERKIICFPPIMGIFPHCGYLQLLFTKYKSKVLLLTSTIDSEKNRA